eukprot:351285-Chlamydomonas_euryale.AAC.7
MQHVSRERVREPSVAHGGLNSNVGQAAGFHAIHTCEREVHSERAIARFVHSSKRHAVESEPSPHFAGGVRRPGNSTGGAASPTPPTPPTRLVSDAAHPSPLEAPTLPVGAHGEHRCRCTAQLPHLPVPPLPSLRLASCLPTQHPSAVLGALWATLSTLILRP